MYSVHIYRNTYTADVAIRKVAVSLADSVDLRIILSVLYIITEVMRAEKSADGEHRQQVDDFIAEISECAMCLAIIFVFTFLFVYLSVFLQTSHSAMSS